MPPLQFPKATRAIAELRIAMDADPRPLARLPEAADLVRRVRTYIGLTIEPEVMDTRLARAATAVEVELRRQIAPTSDAGDDSSAPSQTDIEAQARPLVLAAGSCTCVPNARLGCWSPSPERSGVCPVLSALTDTAMHTAALVAVHDDVLIARTIIADDVRIRSSLLSHPSSELIDQWVDTAATRPIFALGIALATEFLFASHDSDQRVACWKRLGDVPLDIAERQCSPSGH